MKKTILIAAMILSGIFLTPKGVIGNHSYEMAENTTKKCKVTIVGTIDGKEYSFYFIVEGMTCDELIRAVISSK